MHSATFFAVLWLVIGGTLAVESNLLKTYDQKVCENEPTCHLTNQQNLPTSRRTLHGRDCMCDFECVEYGDCCKDSEFYGAATASGRTYSCSPSAQVYMITSCPPDYYNPSVVSKCSASLRPLDGPDNSVIRPATNTKRRITYGNAYCAQCNNDIDDITLWPLGARCGEAPSGYLNARKRITETPEDNELPTPKNFYPTTTAQKQRLPFDFSNYLNKNRIGFIGRRKREALSIDFNRYRKDLDNILKYVRYDYNTKHFISQYNGKDFICEFEAQKLQDIDLYARKCVPNMITSCPPNTDRETAAKCSLNTAIVYEKATKKAFKNRDCAKCNGIPEISVSGCRIEERTAGSSLFSTSDKGSSAPCDTPELRKKFCS